MHRLCDSLSSRICRPLLKVETGGLPSSKMRFETGFFSQEQDAGQLREAHLRELSPLVLFISLFIFMNLLMHLHKRQLYLAKAAHG